MSFLGAIRRKISPSNPLLLAYHRAIGIAAAIRYGFPGNKIKIIAITGTKGKSTTTHMLANILSAAGHKVGVASTIHFQIGDRIWMNTTKQTTQGRFALQRLLREMVDERCDFAILEVTSHALVQSRIWGINVDIAILTNIQNDHLEYHGGFENYMHAKGLLFAGLARSERKGGLLKTAILPAEDPNLAYFENFPIDRKMLYGLSKGMITALDIVPSSDSSRFTLKVPNGEVSINLALPGEFNVHNALAAISAALAAGVKLQAIKKGLENELIIPGRLEPVRAGQNFSVIVDYAHTTESLEALLKLFKSLTKGTLWLVFGATGGGRDKSKRAEMGEVADRYADEIIVTDDDPYTEDRMVIIDALAAGMKRSEGEHLWKIRDRRQAMRLALSLAKEGDTVVIAGKGCEPIQIIGEERIPWDDRLVAREIMGSELKVAL